MGLEMVLYRVYYYRRITAVQNGDVESSNGVQSLLRQASLSGAIDLKALQRSFMSPVRDWLRDALLKDQPRLFSLLDRSMDLNSILRVETTVRNSSRVMDPETSGRGMHGFSSTWRN